MARIELAQDIALDFERILRHLESFDVEHTAERIHEITDAIDVLGRNPRIGRPVSNDLRELVIGRGAHGYVACYQYDEILDIVFVLAIRHQSEAGFSGN